MISLESKSEMILMVLTDLAATCKKLAEHSAAPEELRTQARKFVEDFNALLQSCQRRGTALQREECEDLLFAITRFLPSVLEVEATKQAA